MLVDDFDDASPCDRDALDVREPRRRRVQDSLIDVSVLAIAKGLQQLWVAFARSTERLARLSLAEELLYLLFGALGDEKVAHLNSSDETSYAASPGWRASVPKTCRNARNSTVNTSVRVIQ